VSVVGFPGGKRSDGVCRTYRMTSRSHPPVIVLATQLPDAIGVLMRWRAKHAIDEVGLSVEPGWGKSLSSAGSKHVEEALARCKGPCVAHRYRADIGWELASPEGAQNGW